MLGARFTWTSLNRRAAFNFEGPSVVADEFKTMLSWSSLQARREYLKCVLVYKCLHSMAPSYILSEFRHAHQIHSYNKRGLFLLTRCPKCFIILEEILKYYWSVPKTYVDNCSLFLFLKCIIFSAKHLQQNKWIAARSADSRGKEEKDSHCDGSFDLPICHLWHVFYWCHLPLWQFSCV